MEPSSRTPEGESHRCPVCGKDVRIEPSRPPGDAPCPHCGSLLWFEPSERSIAPTLQAIKTLAAEIEQLSRCDVLPEYFFSAFVNHVIAATAAVGGAVWIGSREGPLTLRYSFNLRQTDLLESQDSLYRHTVLLYKALSGSEGLLVPPNSESGEERVAENPLDFPLLLAPLRIVGRNVGLIEIVQRKDSTPIARLGNLRFLTEMTAVANASPVIQALK